MEEKLMCPECGQKAMISNQNNMECENCDAIIPVDILMMSYELLEKDIAMHAMRMFLKPGTGICIEFNENIYIVGFTSNDDLVVIEHKLQEDEQVGMFVNLVDSIEENNQEEEE